MYKINVIADLVITIQDFSTSGYSQDRIGERDNSGNDKNKTNKECLFTAFYYNMMTFGVTLSEYYC